MFGNLKDKIYDKFTAKTQITASTQKKRLPLLLSRPDGVYPINVATG
tara:strand:- start:1016 stop:1156 length:141 start_codon:yes stop_codon:yes gene_type:complete